MITLVYTSVEQTEVEQRYASQRQASPNSVVEQKLWLIFEHPGGSAHSNVCRACAADLPRGGRCTAAV